MERIVRSFRARNLFMISGRAYERAYFFDLQLKPAFQNDQPVRLDVGSDHQVNEQLPLLPATAWD